MPASSILPPAMNRVPFVLALALVGVFGVACKPQIGDECKTSIDCSTTGSRVCDTASPGGYCSIRGCDPNGCPDDAVCVEWRYTASRTSETWCMRKCGRTSDCDRGGYACFHEGDASLVDEDGQPLARVTDFDARATAGFCAYAGN